MKQKELINFRERLNKEKEEILRNLDFNSKEIEFLKNIEIKDEGDLVSVGNGKNVDVAISKRQVQKLQEIELAFTKMSNNAYGICEMCEEKISMHRLKAKPQARYCIICREIVEKSK